MRTRRRVAHLTLAAALLVAPGLAACDREDQRDVEEEVENLDQQVDQLDTDGKDE